MKKDTAILLIILGVVAGWASSVLTMRALGAVMRPEPSVAHAVAPVQDSVLLEQQLASCQDVQTTLVKQRDGSAQAAESFLQKIQEYKSNANVVTILYEPGPPLAVPVYKNILSLQLNGTQQPSNPRWYVPYKVTPEVAGRANGLMYVYFDAVTRKLDGPYVPQIVPPAQ